MSYIDVTDIKANLIAGFDVAPYIEEADDEINDVAERLGVRGLSSIKVPVHYKIKRYGIAFILKRLAQDKIGTNQPDISLEKYKEMFLLYSQELKELFPQLTSQMFTGDVGSIIDRTSTVGNFYRG
jgi:hypothetical protein